MPLEFVTPLTEKSRPEIRAESLGSRIRAISDEAELNGLNLVLIGVADDRGLADHHGAAAGPHEVRKYLYNLEAPEGKYDIGDLGNVMPGNEIRDTYVALGKLVGELLARKIVPIIIGGTHDLTYGQYLGYKNLEQFANVGVIDSRISLGLSEGEADDGHFLGHVLTETPNYIFNLGLLGLQGHFVAPKTLEILERLHFEFLRLGEVRNNFEDAEPLIRDMDMISFNMAAIRQSEAPGQSHPSPNGFYGEEACKLARFAGISDKVSSFGIYEVNPTYDRHGQTAHLAAQTIWYFLDGFLARTNEYPEISESGFLKYIVYLQEDGHELAFWKSRRSGRWWLELPDSGRLLAARHRWIPCAYADYERACAEEVPERWLRASARLNV